MQLSLFSLHDGAGAGATGAGVTGACATRARDAGAGLTGAGVGAGTMDTKAVRAVVSMLWTEIVTCLPPLIVTVC